MLDKIGFEIAKAKVFYASGSSTLATNDWQSWIKPRNANMFMFVAVPSGGGGAGGVSGAGTTGAGGGASPPIAKLQIPAFAIPDMLFFRPATGGLGGAAASAGGATIASLVCVAPNSTTANILLQSGVANAAAVATTGGTQSVSTSPLSIMGMYVAPGGISGANGASAANTAGVAANYSQSFAPGAGGGNGTGAGGAVTGTGLFPSSVGGVGTTGGAGVHGFMVGGPPIQLFGPRAFLLTGGPGSGGGGHGTGVGGRGGDGGYGSGGGGGGGTSGAGGVGGAGGRGGDGFILVTWW